jgi:hypothetical protein
MQQVETLNLLPSSHSQADAEWIKQQLLSLTPTARQKAIQRYAAVYQERSRPNPFPTARRTGQGMKQIQGFACL